MNWCDDTTHRKAWLLPWLSIEALLEDSLNLFQLLHDRTTYGVDDWVSHENLQLDYGWETGALRTQFNEKCVVLYGTEYGKLVPYDLFACHQFYKLGYHRARLLLEAQAVMHRFLRNVVETLLDRSNAQHGSTKWKQTFCGPRASEAVKMLDPSSARLPDTTFEVLCEHVDAQSKAAGDELWLLQTDAAYVHYRIRQELSMSTVKCMEEETRWAYIVMHVFYPAIRSYDGWRFCAELCRTAANVQRRHHNKARPEIKTTDLPLDYRRAMLLLERYCNIMGENFTNDLQTSIAGCKGFEKYYDFTRRDNGGTLINPIIGNRELFFDHQSNHAKDPLY